MQQKLKPVFDHRIAQWLVQKGHTVVKIGKGSRGDSCYLFNATPTMLKDFATKVHEIRDVRI